MYDVHNNLAPSNIKNISFVHSYRTRSVTNENITTCMLSKLELKI